MINTQSNTKRIPKTVKLFIGGEFPRTESGRSFKVLNKKTQELYANLCQASRKDLRNAVSAARAALSDWEKKTAYNRGQILYRAAEMCDSKRIEFDEIFTEVLGDSTAAAQSRVDSAIDAFVYYAGFADKVSQITGSINPVAGPHHCFTTPEPTGVIGMIFEAPMDLGKIVAEISAAICCGNTVVALLPEEGAPVLAPLAETLATSDLPKGVVNLLTGHRDELAEHFGSHMEIHGLSYQGNDDALRAKLSTLAITNMKRMANVTQEPLSLERILQYLEFKTVWHPSGF